MTPQQFFSKNLKWITLCLLLLLCFKYVQSCNRKMGNSITQKQNIHMIDSLKTDYSNLKSEYNDTIKKLNFELTLEKEKAHEADKRALAVQSVAEKLKSNTTTTVNVRGAVIDTIKRK